MKKINEDGIGSNYHTIDPKPIDFFHDTRIAVEMTPTAWGQYGVQVTCPELGYDSGFRKYQSEEEATLFARNQYSSLINELGANEVLESVIAKILELV